MKFTLVENAKDSLEHAVEHLVTSDGSKAANLKRVILDLSHTIELILKERLARIHPAFVYKDVDTFRSKKGFTVSADGARKRLEKVGDVAFSDADRTTLKNCTAIRNVIEHFEFELSEAEAEVIIGRVLSFVITFSQEELDLEWRDELMRNDSWPKLLELSEFWLERSKIVEAEIEKNEIPTETCPTCLIETFDMDELTCRLCGHKEEPVECAMCKEQFLESLADDPEVGLCRRCAWEDGYASAHHEKY